MSIKEKATEAYQRLESQRHEIMRLSRSLSPQQRLFSPKSDQWNLLQVLRHLITAESRSLAFIQKKIESKQKIRRTGLGTVIRFILLKLALISPLKFQAPKIAQVREKDPGFESMMEEWENIRMKLKVIIESSDDETLAKAVYKHPRAGYLNVKQAVEFFETHIAHHQKQIGRIMNHPSFPSGNR